MATVAGSKRKQSPVSVTEIAKKARLTNDPVADDVSVTETEHSVAHSTTTSIRDASEATRATSTPPSQADGQTTPRPKNYACDFPGCGKSYTRPTRLAEHHRSHTNERPFVCHHERCDKSYQRDSHLKHHLKSVHENQRDWVCDWPDCGKAFVTGQRYRAHKERHEKKEQYKCNGYPPCVEYFRKQETLDRHIMKVHLQDKPYICDHVDADTRVVCGRKFNSSSQMISHAEREHSGNRYWCNLCRPPGIEDDVIITGGIAGAVGFATHGEMQHHIKTFHPPTCPECGQVCQTRGQLTAHVDIQHGNNLDERRKFFCEFPGCDRSFTKKGNLQVHARTVHEKQRQYICGESQLTPSETMPAWDGKGACGRPMVSRAALESHVRTQHLHLPRLGGKKPSKRGKDWDTESEEHSQQDTRMGNAPAAVPQSTIGLLTGVGYEESRPIACSIVPCPQRFHRAYDLELHLEACHGFTSLAAMESALEQEALSGGQFWIGGSEDEDTEDSHLAHRLQHALNAGDAAED